MKPSTLKKPAILCSLFLLAVAGISCSKKFAQLTKIPTVSSTKTNGQNRSTCASRLQTKNASLQRKQSCLVGVFYEKLSHCLLLARKGLLGRGEHPSVGDGVGKPGGISFDLLR